MAKWTMTNAAAKRILKVLSEDTGPPRLDDLLDALRKEGFGQYAGLAIDALMNEWRGLPRPPTYIISAIARSAAWEAIEARGKLDNIKSGLNAAGLLDREDVEEMITDALAKAAKTK